MLGLAVGLIGLVLVVGFQISEEANRENGVAGLQFIAVCFFVSILTAATCVNRLIKRSPWQPILLYLIICILATAAGAYGLRVRWSPQP
jgi:hypothetical protein